MSYTLQEVTDAFNANEAPRRYCKHGKVGRRAQNVAATLRQLCETIIPADQLLGRKPTVPAPPGSPGGRMLGAIDVDDLQAADLEDFMHQLSHRLVRGRPKFTETTVNDYRTNVLTVLRWAVSRKAKLASPTIIAEAEAVGPIEPGRTPARKRRKVDVIPDEDLEKRIDLARKYAASISPSSRRNRQRRQTWKVFALAMIVQRETGMRPDELAIMRTRDIVCLDGKWYYRPASHKTEHHDEEREIPLSWRAKEALDEAYMLRITDGAQHVLGFAQEFDGDSRIFGWEAKVQPSNGYYQKWRELERKFGLDHFTPNQVRHTAITEFAQHDLLGASAIAGHRNLTTTQNYIHKKREAAQRVLDARDQSPGG